MGQMARNKIYPEIGHFLVGEPARHIDVVFLEPVFLEDALEAPVANEDRVMALGAQTLGDAHAVERRPESCLRIEDDRLFLGHDFPYLIAGWLIACWREIGLSRGKRSSGRCRVIEASPSTSSG